MNCSSFTLSTVICKVDHWNLIVSSISKTVVSGEIIDLNVTYIKNPAYTGRLFNNIGVYLYNSTNIKAIINEYTGVLISQAGSSIRLRTIDTTAYKLQEFSNYQIFVYLDHTSLSVGDSLIIQFPAEFSLVRDNSDSLICSAS